MVPSNKKSSFFFSVFKELKEKFFLLPVTLQRVLIKTFGTSLVQWLRLSVANAGGVGSIPGWET